MHCLEIRGPSDLHTARNPNCEHLRARRCSKQHATTSEVLCASRCPAPENFQWERRRLLGGCDDAADVTSNWTRLGIWARPDCFQRGVAYEIRRRSEMITPKCETPSRLAHLFLLLLHHRHTTSQHPTVHVHLSPIDLHKSYFAPGSMMYRLT